MKLRNVSVADIFFTDNWKFFDVNVRYFLWTCKTTDSDLFTLLLFFLNVDLIYNHCISCSLICQDICRMFLIDSFLIIL